MSDYLRPIAAYVASQHHTRTAVRPVDDQPDTATDTADTAKDRAVTEADSRWSR
ncbi:hypothetical protein [Nocardia vulneris]|uniref:hypothetical protein n=1 Tax=Nocardia vulneris TaxID=1141657 RepID=UPI000B0FDDB8|nr:hypothetical protein [Nocardia vulneris]